MKTAKICNKKLNFADDFGDNPCTFHCGLPKGHKGKHKETGEMFNGQLYSVTFTNPIKEE
jgi:hypothetical protein